MGDFEQDTRVEGEHGCYTATPSEEWRIWGPMGGYAASIAFRAAAAEVARELAGFVWAIATNQPLRSL